MFNLCKMIAPLIFLVKAQIIFIVTLKIELFCNSLVGSFKTVLFFDTNQSVKQCVSILSVHMNDTFVICVTSTAKLCFKTSSYECQKFKFYNLKCVCRY